MSYNVSDFFPQLSREEVLKRVEEKWHITGRLPLPKFKPSCPICKSKESLIKNCTKHDRSTTKPKGRIGYRCDVAFKCTSCSHVWVHGVAIPKEMYERTSERFFEWREVMEVYQIDYNWISEEEDLELEEIEEDESEFYSIEESVKLEDFITEDDSSIDK